MSPQELDIGQWVVRLVDIWVGWLVSNDGTRIFCLISTRGHGVQLIERYILARFSRPVSNRNLIHVVFFFLNPLKIEVSIHAE